jgi:hypothetical protein
MSRVSEFGDLSASTGTFSHFFSSRPRLVLLLFRTTSAFSPTFPYDLGFFSFFSVRSGLFLLAFPQDHSPSLIPHDLSLFSLLFSRHLLFFLLFLTTSAFSSFFSRPSVRDQCYFGTDPDPRISTSDQRADPDRNPVPFVTRQ